MSSFKFTADIYTGEQKSVIVPIAEVILGIAVALETDSKTVYGGHRDEQENVPEFGINSIYIKQLRHSPEYHDAVLNFILKLPVYIDYIVPQYRGNCFDAWKEIMHEHGVLGTISIYPNSASEKTFKTLTKPLK